MVHISAAQVAAAGILASLTLCEAGRFPTKSIDRPEFTPLQIPNDLSSLVLFEDFTDGGSRWKIPGNSGNKKSTTQLGRWSFEESTVNPGFKGDVGLVMKSTSARHAIWTELDWPLDNIDNTLVIQYEVKHQKNIKCGGAYIKLFTETNDLHSSDVSQNTPYQVMFGPDQCGSTDKVHFIINRMNPFTGKYEEKNLVNPPKVMVSKTTNLYTLIMYPNQDYEIRINGKVAKAGSLTANGTFNPPLNPPATTPDANEVKPREWDDRKFILDSSQIAKPSYWDENAPYEIEDPLASKPPNWDESVPLFIPDPEATIPEDWDEEEDGEFVAPEIRNPECQYHGCGPWSAPLIKNPAFFGAWEQPLIENPNYKGDWHPKMVPNTQYYEDISPSNLEPIGGIGFDLWTVESNVLFDNIYVGHSVDQAEYIGNKTFIPKLKIEREMEKMMSSGQVVEPVDPRKLSSTKGNPDVLDLFLADPVNFIFSRYKKFFFDFVENPVDAFMSEPALAVASGTFCFVFSVITFALLNILVYLIRVSLGMAPNYSEDANNTQVSGKSVLEENSEVSSSATENPTQVTKRSVDKSHD